jgi:ubiquinone/menaquinone biosynthesis C-methylase UbiE
MDRSEFDKFADEYTVLHQTNIALSGETPDYFAEYKIKDLKSLVGDDPRGIHGARFLDLGAGVGTSVPFFRKHFPSAHVTCVDVSMKSLKIGVARFAGHASFTAFDGICLPFADSTFDYVFAACVFHHVPPSEHSRLFKEMWRALKPGGRIMIYEHNPLNPLTVKAINTCPFDENAVLIGAHALKARLVSVGFQQLQIRYRVFFPRALRWLRPLEQWLGWLPMGAQYYVHGKR